ncbi:hypothetical protein ACET3Z_000767 [Daucus carota]
MGGKSKADQKGKEKKFAPTWVEKKAMVDREEDAIEEEIQEQEDWIAMVKGMDNLEMKNYLSSRPDHLKAENLEKCEPSKRTRKRGGNGKSSSTSNKIRGTVWMFNGDGK